MVGLDVVLDIEGALRVDPPWPPEGRRLVRKLIDEGGLAVKSGRGVYDYHQDANA
jgi:3-hydroxyacyl-CoA dehydrogenase